MAPGYRSGQSRRANRGLVDHDVFEGLPIRSWKRDTVIVAPPVLPETTAQKDIWDVELPWGMPKNSHLLPQHSQDLLRLARSGKLYQRRPIVEEEEVDVDPLTGEKTEKKVEDTGERGFPVKTWKLVPRHLEGPEIEYLAKRRKGLRVRRTDAEGNSYVEDVVVPQGQTVEGEVIAQTVIADSATNGVASEVAPPVRRRPPPPKRKAKGPGRGRKKKQQVPLPATRLGGQPNGTSGQESAVGPDGIKLEGQESTNNGGKDGQMEGVEDSMLPSDEEGDEGDEGEDGDEGASDEEGEGEGDGDEEQEHIIENDPASATPAVQPVIEPESHVATDASSALHDTNASSTSAAVVYPRDQSIAKGAATLPSKPTSHNNEDEAEGDDEFADAAVAQQADREMQDAPPAENNEDQLAQHVELSVKHFNESNLQGQESSIDSPIPIAVPQEGSAQQEQHEKQAISPQPEPSSTADLISDIKVEVEASRQLPTISTASVPHQEINAAGGGTPSEIAQENAPAPINQEHMGALEDPATEDGGDGDSDLLGRLDDHLNEQSGPAPSADIPAEPTTAAPARGVDPVAAQVAPVATQVITTSILEITAEGTTQAEAVAPAAERAVDDMALASAVAAETTTDTRQDE